MKTTGLDIVSKRITKLEKKAFEEILKSKRKLKILDLASGSSFFGLSCVFFGQRVFLYDKKINLNIKIIKKIFKLKNLIYQKQNLKKINYKTFPKNIDIVYCSRFLHYLKYNQTENFLKILKKTLNNEGKIFFSISGINSELSKDYEDKEKNIQDRFSKLSFENQKKFKIKQKVCLYSKNETKELFEKYFKIQDIWESDFGNIFVIAKNRKN
ncbi:hypothetical protein CSB11_02560 [Candidatus Campbellbacteria bacterium]|nr:MAG: hypothetical protein CSB11_02560 [Candidatus Campbellbacteria bacterium]